MSISVNFYTFQKRDNSTKRPTGNGTSLNCTLKYASSIIRPVLQINSVVNNPARLNYAYISDYGRYYWVTDWTWDRGFWYVSLEVDVLATYKTEIGASTLYVVRSDSAYTPALPDGKYPMKNQVTMLDNVLSSDFASTLWGLNFRSGGCYVLGVIGRGAKTSDGVLAPNGGGVTYYALTPTEMKNLIEYMFGGNMLSTGDVISLEIQKEIFNPFQYIVSCQWIPTDLASSPHTVPAVIRFGYWYDDTVIGNYIPENMRNIEFNATAVVPRHPQASRGTYLNGRPYTELDLSCFSFGDIPIDPTPFVDSPNMSLTIEMDMFTGTGFLNIYSPTGKRIHRQAGQLGVPVQLSQITQNLVNTAISTVETAFNIGLGNYIGAFHGIISATEGLFPQVRTSGEVGSASAFRLMPILTTKHHMIADENKTLLGRPCCTSLQINTLSGFIVVESGDIDCDATYNESNSIKSYLEGGFFYE